MKNPLVLFVGAAVVAVAALAGATADRWKDWPGPVQPTASSPEAVTETAGPPELRREQPAEAEAGPAPQEPEEPVAALDTGEVDSFDDIERPDEIAEAPVEAPERLAAVDAREAQPVTPVAPVEPEPEPQPEALAQPSFDVVRLAEDGSLIVAGLAAPGASVTLLLDGEAIASDAANDVGAWLLMPVAPLPPGSHQLMVQARDADTGAQTSGTIAVAVPERAADRPRVAHSEPAQPLAAEDDRAAEPEPDEPGPVESGEPARLEPEEPLSGEGGEEQVALAPEQELDVEGDAPVVQESEPETFEAEREELAAVAPPEAELERELERRDIPLALETVDYDDDGDIVFSGRADPGSLVRVHVDNRFIGETTADADGRWAFTGKNEVAPGRHTLHADLMGADGNVVGRIILPFVRADGREVAALVEARRDAARQQEPTEAAPEVDAPEPAEAEPEPTAIADEVAPDPEPEAPVVADEVVPEPEPEAAAVADVATESEAPEVADEAAPDPEPEAPIVAEEVVPKPEPEIAAVADVAPEPDRVAVADVESEPAAEAPVVVDEVAPGPEPEVPVMTDEVQPEPETAAPAVADEVASEPEAEAPVVSDGVAPALEPEPEAPAVADVSPEPEPEGMPQAPAMTDDVAPEPEAHVVAEEVAPDPESELQTALTGEAVPEPDAEAEVAAAEPEAIEVEDTDEPAAEEPAEPAVEEPAEIGEPEVAAARPGHVVIQPGNNLWRISRVIYGRGIEYTAIYQANRDKISDPDLIYPGQIFATPGVDPPKEIDPEWREPLSEGLARQDNAE